MQIIHQHFERLDSTNTWALQNANALRLGMLHLTTTDEQTNGRGRFGHSWQTSKETHLIATYSFLVEKTRTDIGNIPQLMALSAAKMLSSLGMTPQLKWPNDLLIAHKKIGGILTETTFIDDEQLLMVAVGVGINVNVSSTELEKLNCPATSVVVETGKLYSISTLLDFLSYYFKDDLTLFLRKGFEPFVSAYRNQFYINTGESVSFHANGNIVKGFFKEITKKGTLQIHLLDGNISEFVSGEIVY